MELPLTFKDLTVSLLFTTKLIKTFEDVHQEHKMDSRTTWTQILPFAERYNYLSLASVCKLWGDILKKLKYKKVTAYTSVTTSISILQWAKSKSLPWTNYVCASTANGGCLEVLKWARENGAPWDWKTCAYAAAGKHFKVLKWTRRNGAPWDESTCTYAAEEGHLEALQWARENGAPWGESTCAYAAEGGHLEVLK